MCGCVDSQIITKYKQYRGRGALRLGSTRGGERDYLVIVLVQLCQSVAKVQRPSCVALA